MWSVIEQELWSHQSPSSPIVADSCEAFQSHRNNIRHISAQSTREKLITSAEISRIQMLPHLVTAWKYLIEECHVTKVIKFSFQINDCNNK